jgi:hypothetical protein
MSRKITIISIVAITTWTSYLTYAITAAVHPHVGPLPHGLRTALPAVLVAATVLIALYVVGRRLLAELDVQPRCGGGEPPGGCRNVLRPPEPPPSPAVYTGRARVGDDASTIDLAAGFIRVSGDQAALYIPRGVEVHRWLPELASVAAAEGCRAETLVRDWPDLFVLFGSGLIDVGIIPSWDHVNPRCTPRIVAADQYAVPELTPGRRRPAILGRSSPAGPQRPGPSIQE